MEASSMDITAALSLLQNNGAAFCWRIQLGPEQFVGLSALSGVDNSVKRIDYARDDSCFDLPESIRSVPRILYASPTTHVIGLYPDFGRVATQNELTYGDLFHDLAVGNPLIVAREVKRAIDQSSIDFTGSQDTGIVYTVLSLQMTVKILYDQQNGIQVLSVERVVPRTDFVHMVEYSGFSKVDNFLLAIPSKFIITLTDRATQSTVLQQHADLVSYELRNAQVQSWISISDNELARSRAKVHTEADGSLRLESLVSELPQAQAARSASGNATDTALSSADRTASSAGEWSKVLRADSLGMPVFVLAGSVLIVTACIWLKRRLR
jgi:hypothetical protein